MAKRTTTTFNFDPDTTAVLDDLKRRYHASSKAEVLRKAIGLLKLARDAQDRGESIAVGDPGKKPNTRVLIP